MTQSPSGPKKQPHTKGEETSQQDDRCEPGVFGFGGGGPAKPPMDEETERRLLTGDWLMDVEPCEDCDCCESCACECPDHGDPGE